jgi:hypothetical protein
VNHPLSIHCSTLKEVQEFLVSCKQASDKEIFSKDDYWLPPDEFEETKQGTVTISACGPDGSYRATRPVVRRIGRPWLKDAPKSGRHEPGVDSVNPTRT